MKQFFKRWAHLLLPVLGIVLIVTAFACSRQPAGQEGETKTKTVTEEAPPSKENIKVENNKVAVIETDKGTIKFTFYPDEAPNTVENFVKLANQGFYNGIKFHRVEPGFVIQGGDPNSKDDDPTNDGQGDPGYTIDAEFSDLNHVDGTVAMARSSDPNSAGSQFYICLADQPSLDRQYTIFGQVSEGLDVVHKIQKGDVMKKVYIEEK